MKICRVCMEGEETQLISIFSELNDSSIAETIASSCSVQLSQDDGLPNQICDTCVQDVKLVIAFVGKVRQSDLKLRQLSKPNTGEESSFEVVVIKTESMDEANDSVDELGQENLDFKSESDSDNDKLALVKRRIRRTRKIKLDDEYIPETRKKLVKRKRKTAMQSDNESEQENERNILSEKELEMFYIITLPESSFVCCCCYQFFDSLEQLESHVEVHTRHAVKKTESIHCAVCKRKFNKTAALNRHMEKVKSVTKLYECIKCKIRFMNGIGRKMHAQRHPKNIEEKMKQEYGEILCCVQNCSKPFSSEELLIKHGHEAHKLNKRAYELEDSPLKPVECPVCFKRFASERLLRRHRKRNSKPLNHQCATCGLKFRTKDVLSLHEMNHDNQKPFQCDVCQKHFSSKNSLKVHQRKHSNEKPFVCATCGAAFFQKAQLTIHEHNHKDAPLPFQCEVCDKSFKMKNYLVNHMRQHTGEKPYPCRHCPMSFSNHTNRQRHEMNHTGDKPFKCTYCDKTFTIKRLQLEHECKHTGIKPFKCSYCDKTFIRKRFQLDHEATHTGNKPYQCELCSRSFSHKTGLRRHLESHSQASDNVTLLGEPSPTQQVGELSMSSPLPVQSTPPASTLVNVVESIAGGTYIQHSQNQSLCLHPTI